MAVLTDYTFDGRSIVRDVFIETGTFRGDTLAHAVAAGFRELHSIDLVPEHVQAARQRFASCPHVAIHHGSSPDVLGRIIDPSRATTFWLDAHFQDNDRREMAPRLGECPLLQELAVIATAPWTLQPVAVIDDAFMFRRPWAPHYEQRFRIEDWPTVEEIRRLLPRHQVIERNAMLWCISGHWPSRQLI